MTTTALDLEHVEISTHSLTCSGVMRLDVKVYALEKSSKMS
jgi:hypothetical protein